MSFNHINTFMMHKTFYDPAYAAIRQAVGDRFTGSECRAVGEGAVGGDCRGAVKVLGANGVFYFTSAKTLSGFLSRCLQGVFGFRRGLFSDLRQEIGPSFGRADMRSLAVSREGFNAALLAYDLKNNTVELESVIWWMGRFGLECFVFSGFAG